MRRPPTVLLALAASFASPAEEGTTLQLALETADRSIENGEHERARIWLWRALERDPKSIEAWETRARWGESSGDRDEQIYALHRLYRLSVAQGTEGFALKELRRRVFDADPLARDLTKLRDVFIDRLLPLASRYERDGRPHSALAVYREVLALDPEHEDAQASVERVTSLPDPSLAENATQVDLFADVSDEWIAKHDEKHADWSNKATYKSEYYNVNTSAGYRILIQSAEAMDQMHEFYKRFFLEDGQVPRIDLNIFRSRAEYLKKGIGPPVEWSGGHFTGGAVEVFVGPGGFQGTLNTLFHEAAHQFVDRSTTAKGWLNEGIASFFEGTRLLANGTVLMNLPARHRLFPLARRMEAGWMADADDGTSRDDPNRVPRTSPTFGIVLENRYEWGPAWYAPTWGVVFWAYNYQDPVDGRFIYRDAFLEFLNKSGGRTGGSAVSNFEDVVLANPAPPTDGTETSIPLPTTVDELDGVWRDWILGLRDEVLGTEPAERPYLEWGEYALERGQPQVAKEHFEKGLAEDPDDAALLETFARLLADELDNEDRAAKLLLQALRVLESGEDYDEREVKRLEKLLYRWDRDRRDLDRIHEELWASARGLVQRYLSEESYLMTMDLATRLTAELGVPGLMPFYEEAWRRSGKTLQLWKLAYNERDLTGWTSGGSDEFQPDGSVLESRVGTYSTSNISYTTLPLDVATTGDYSMEVQVRAERGEVGFAGIVFGMKNASTFNALLFLPGKETGGGALASSGFVDLATFSGADTRTWRHVPVVANDDERRSRAESWVTLRLDVTGPFADVWIDGELKVVHEFPSRASVSGSLGLVTGSGRAGYRSVRYVTRNPLDVGARLARDERMAELESSDTSVGGSWLGKRPPFPEVSRWVQGERESWGEVGLVPQLLVMFSIRQNDLVQINKWLNWLAEKYADVGLEIICVGSIEDRGQLGPYLAKQPFPGAVALDGDGEGLGDTFTDYSIELFNLPRLILIDIDGRVVWEGDPGFSSTKRWLPGTESFLEPPLEDLVRDRGLRTLYGWRERWRNVGAPAMHDGNLADALELMEEAEAFEPKGDADVFEARNRLRSLHDALRNIELTVELIERERGNAAIEVLLEWGESIGEELDRRTLKELRPAMRGEYADAWDDLETHLKRHESRVRRTDPETALAELREHLEGLEGRFPALVLERLEGVDPIDVADLFEDIERLPREWLAREYFRW